MCFRNKQKLCLLLRHLYFYYKGSLLLLRTIAWTSCSWYGGVSQFHKSHVKIPDQKQTERHLGSLESEPEQADFEGEVETWRQKPQAASGMAQGGQDASMKPALSVQRSPGKESGRHTRRREGGPWERRELEKRTPQILLGTLHKSLDDS